jgi:hypothetical protein
MGLMGNPKILAALVGAGVLAPTDAEAMPKVFRGYKSPEFLEGKWWTPSKRYAKHYAHNQSTGGVAEAEIPEGLKILNSDTDRDTKIWRRIRGDLQTDWSQGRIGQQNFTNAMNDKLRAAGYDGVSFFKGSELHLVDVPEITNPNILKALGIGVGAASLYSPQNAQARQYQRMAEQQSLQEPTFDPTNLVAPGGLMGNIGGEGIGAFMKYLSGQRMNTESGI